MSSPVSNDIQVRQKRPRVLIIFENPRHRTALEDEYGKLTVAKLISGAMEEIDPTRDTIHIQLPPGKNQPLIPLGTKGDREGYDVAVFVRGKFLERDNLLEYIFRRVEPFYVDDEEIKAKAAPFRPGLRYD